MKTFSLIGKFTVALALIQPLSLEASEYSAASEVSKVTLFPDRAEITRKASLQVGPGNHQIFLHGVPQSVAAESLRAAGSGAQGTSILGVELKQIPLRHDFSAEVKSLEEKLASLELQKQDLSRTQASLEKQRTMLMSLELNPAVPESEKTVRPRTAKEISELLTLVSDGNKRIDTELKSIQESSDKIAKEIEFTRAKLNTLQAPQKIESAIALNISSEKHGTVDLEVSYQVANASWNPSYNLNENKEKFSLDTFALISQRSGEDWKNVSLTLSTARPQVRLDRPDPKPIFLDIFRPLQPASRQASNEIDSYGLADGAQAFLEKAKVAGKKQELISEAEPLRVSTAEVNLGAIVSYNISHPVSLKSDGTVEKVKVTTSELGGKLTNVLVPAYSSEVYREALLTNASELPLLPGRMNIFSDSRFLGSRNLHLTQAGEEIRSPLGASQNLTVKRTLLKKYEDDSGIVRSVRRIRHDYLIEVVNNSKEEQKATILEPAPLSGNEGIKVSYDDISPANLRHGDKARIKDQEGIMEWQLNIPAKSRQEIKYSTIVEFQAGTAVNGIDSIR